MAAVTKANGALAAGAVRFIKAYSDCLDTTVAGKKAGLDEQDVAALLANPRVQARLEQIDTWADTAVQWGQHGAIHRFFETRDLLLKAVQDGEKGSANALASLAKTELEANGFNRKETGPKAANISITINMPDGRPAPSVVIEGKVEDETN